MDDPINLTETHKLQYNSNVLAMFNRDGDNAPYDKLALVFSQAFFDEHVFITTCRLRKTHTIPAAVNGGTTAGVSRPTPTRSRACAASREAARSWRSRGMHELGPNSHQNAPIHYFRSGCGCAFHCAFAISSSTLTPLVCARTSTRPTILATVNDTANKPAIRERLITNCHQKRYH